jgi:hypothetical protein
MNGLPNRTKITSVAADTAFTGSIQKLYSTGSMILSSVEFGYFERIGQTGSKAIITSTTAINSTTACTSIEGPIVQFKTAAGSAAVLVYSNKVTL